MTLRPYPAFPLLCLSAATLAALFDHGGSGVALASTQIPLLAWAVALLRRPRCAVGAPPRSWLLVSLAAFWSWLALSCLWSPVPYVSFLSLLGLGSVGVAAMLYAATPGAEPLRRGAARVLLASGAALAGYGLAQKLWLGEASHSVFLDPHPHTAFLNLLTLPLGAAWLAVSNRDGMHRPRALGLLALWGFMVFAIAVGAGRGTMLGFVVGLCVLTLLAAGAVRLRALTVLVVAAGLAYLAADTASGGGVVATTERLVQSIPQAAQSPRALLLQGSWRMASEGWVTGHGLGLFWLAYPPYRLPADLSLGHHVHNDYLQLLVEVGLPGLILLAAVAAALLHTLRRIRSAAPREASLRIETAGLTAGLAAIAVHSLFTFNFAVPATVLVCGLYLGRVAVLGRRAPAHRGRWAPRGRLPGSARLARAGRVAALVLALAGIGASSAILAAELARASAAAALARQDPAEALQRLSIAASLIGSEVPLLAQAELYTDALAARRRRDGVERWGSDDERLYRLALARLAAAARRNPLRAHTRFERGRLIAVAGPAAGGDWRMRSAAEHDAALRLDPRFVAARLALGNLLIDMGRARSAYRVIAAGLDLPAAETPRLLPYLGLALRLEREQPDPMHQEARSSALSHRIRSIVSRFGLAPAIYERLGISAWMVADGDLG